MNNKTQTYTNFNMINSEKLNVYTKELTKVTLSNFDDKRYILTNGYTSLMDIIESMKLKVLFNFHLSGSY